MASTRKSRNPNKAAVGWHDGLQAGFERALREILARVCISEASTISIAVAYSGGLDSSVLLRLMSDYAAAHPIRLYAFHVHHGLSPNADTWLAHCVKRAAQYGASFSFRSVCISRERGQSIEQEARRARYAALGALCREHNVDLLMTAHHQDDQAETVLLQLMRGAGLPGLSGITAFCKPHPLLGEGIALGRPLLEFSRQELAQAALCFELSHITDESNAELRYRRNAVRHQIAPALEKISPGFASAVARSARHAQSAQLLLNDLAALDLNACTIGKEHEALDLPCLNTLAPHRAENLLRYWLNMQGVQLPSTVRLHEILWQMTTACQDRHPFFDLGPLRLRRIGQRLELHSRLGNPPSEAIRLRWLGEPELIVPEWRGKLMFEKSREVGFSLCRLKEGVLSLRPRSGKERLKPVANRPSRTLKNLFQEQSISLWKRPWLPLLYVDDELVFVAGLGADVRHADSEYGIRLRWICDFPMEEYSMPDS